MDPGIWSGLPDDLLLLILSFLPYKTLINLIPTSKLFRSLFLSPNFVSRHPSNSLSSFVLLSHPQCYDHFPLYDSDQRTWRRLAIPSSNPLTCRAAGETTSFCSSLLLSSSHGLLCFSLSGSSSSSIVVRNILTRSSRKIEFPFYPFPLELLTLIATPIGYSIFALCSSCIGLSPAAANHGCRHVYVYDSKRRSWIQFDGFDQTLDRGFHQEGVFFNGSLYFAKTEPFSLVSFDLETGKWNTGDGGIGALPGDEDIIFARLVSDSYDNKLFLVGGIGRNGISRSIKLWEFRQEEEQSLWVEIETLPEMFCRKFMSVCYHNYEHVYCFWHNETICVCCYNWPEVLYYEIGKRIWHWIQKCPSLPDKWSCGFRWFSFVPRFSASV